MALNTAKSPLTTETTAPTQRPVDVPRLPEQFADESYKLFSQVHVSDPTEAEAIRIRNKCVWRILPFLCIGYHIMYVDKQTLGNSSILGILTDAHLDTSQYNWLVSIFYFAEWPQNWALQKFPVAKWLSLNLINWGSLLLLHIPCSSFGGLFAVRFLLGLAEACIVPSFLIILSMFFTYDEQAVLMPIMWAIGNSSPITSGLLSYGVLFIKTGSFAPWKWFFVITGGITLIFGISVFLLLPDSPLKASFLTLEQRAQAVLRIKGNHSGIEQKRFKRHQFIEALKDPKTWLFFFHAWGQEMANGLTSQYSLIIKSLGFTTLQTTLLGCVSGLVAFITLLIAAFLLAKTTNSRAWISAASYVPVLFASGLSLGLPFTNRWAYSVVMVWAANCSAGHTKKTTVIALYHVAYGLGNILSAQLFQQQYKPRYIVPWTVILVVACIFPASIILFLRYYLSKENKRRDKTAAQGAKQDEVGVLEHVDEDDGTVGEEVVDARQLDLTDRENLAFRYVL